MPSYYVDEDYPARSEIQKPLSERSNHCGSELSTLETDVYVWRFTLLVVNARKEEALLNGLCLNMIHSITQCFFFVTANSLRLT